MIPRSYRLREDYDVRRVRAQGKAWAHGPLVARILPNTIDPARNRYTVIAGKRCGKAVQRNRLKRLVREALRGYHLYLEPGHDIAVICRGTIEEMPTLTEAQVALRKIFNRAGVVIHDPRTNRPVTLPHPGEPIVSGWEPAKVSSKPELSTP